MFKRISPLELPQLIESKGALLADVRDQESFVAAHVPGAFHLSMDRLQSFCQEEKSSQAIVVYCYHGISSQPVAQFLVEQGFDNVYSLDGGFEAWYMMKNKEQQGG